MELGSLWLAILGTTLPTLINIAVLYLALPSLRRRIEKSGSGVVPWYVPFAIPLIYFLIIPFVLPNFPADWVEVKLNNKGGSLHFASCMLSWILGAVFVNWRIGLTNFRDL
jgi:hypothetical protein